MHPCVWHQPVPTPGLFTWPVVHARPPSFSSPRKEQPRRQPAPPARKQPPEPRGVLRPTPGAQRSPLSSPCAPPVSFSSTGVPSSEQSQCVIVPALPTDHQLTRFLCFDRLTISFYSSLFTSADHLVHTRKNMFLFFGRVRVHQTIAPFFIPQSTV